MTVMKQGISSKAVAKYMLLPGVLPWLRRFGRQLSGIFFIFTQVLGTVGLIDKAHPCLRVENRYHYRFSETLAIAWNNLEFSRRNLPQIMMFSAVVLSVILFFAIIGAGFLQVFLSFGTAHAQYLGTPDTSIPYDVNRDWAFEFLERIFGSTINTGVNFWTPADNPSVLGNVWFSGILAGILKTYSQALLFIASVMIIYLVMITLADAARSGRPFGESFDGVWAPLRFVIALGLLVPFSGAGYNGAQLLVFQTAEMGSNLATNIWHRSLEELEDCNSASDPARCNFISTAVADYGYKYLRDIFMVNLCVYGYNAAIQEEGTEDKNEMMNYSKQTIDDETAVFTFGNKRAKTFCGEVILPALMQNDAIQPGFFSDGDPSGGGSRSAEDYLPKAIADGYHAGARLFFPYDGQMVGVASEFAANAFCHHDQDLSELTCDGEPCQNNIRRWIETYWKNGMGRRGMGDELGTDFFQAYNAQSLAFNQWIVESVKRDAKFGWATAGVFYLRLSGAMAEVSKAIGNSPRVSMLPVNFNRMYASPKHPTVTNFTGKIACGEEGDSGWFSSMIDFCEGAPVAISVNNLMQQGAEWFRAQLKEVDPAFYGTLPPSIFQSELKLRDGESAESDDPQSQLSPLPKMILEFIRFDRNDMNPLGTVVGWGDGMFTIASWAYTASIALSLLSWVPGLGLLAQVLGPVLRWIGNIFVIPGFILLFVIPFMPFLYFMFAVVEWMASILEAVIGIPLWVLTFIRREGDLLSPAMDGIKMLFEIMLRPTIIIFSLLVSVIVFSAGVMFFQDALALYMGLYSNGGFGGASSGLAGGVGLVLVMVFGTYALATSCFKMIEAIPNQFGRWLDLDGGFGSQIEMGTSNDFGPMAVAAAVVSTAKTVRGINTEVNKGLYGGDDKLKKRAARDIRKYWEFHNKYKRPLWDADPKDNPKNPNDGASGVSMYTQEGDNYNTSQTRRTAANLYDALGVSRFATEAEIKQAFRKQSMQYHQDKVGEAWNNHAQSKWGIRSQGDIEKDLHAQGLRGAQLTAEKERTYEAQFKDFTAEQMQKFKDERSAFMAKKDAEYKKRQQDLQNAYETLMDKDRRARYDAQNPEDKDKKE